jgi:hypothetical protein
VEKRALYARAGVAHYGLVDVDARVLGDGVVITVPASTSARASSGNTSRSAYVASLGAIDMAASLVSH